MIIVTGATGVLNGATVEHLLKLVPADRIGVSVRDVAKAQHLADCGAAPMTTRRRCWTRSRAPSRCSSSRRAIPPPTR